MASQKNGSQNGKPPRKRPSKKSPTPKAKMVTRAKGPKKTALTPINRLFCREYIMNGGNATEAALSAGISKDRAVAQNASSRLLCNAIIMKEIDRLLTVAGLDDATLVKGIWEGLNAAKIAWVEDPTYTQNGGWRPLASPDYGARAKYLDMICKLRGRYAPIKMDHTTDIGAALEEIFRYSEREPPRLLNPEGSDHD